MFMSFICSLYLRSYFIMIKATILKKKIHVVEYQRKMKIGAACVWLFVIALLMAFVLYYTLSSVTFTADSNLCLIIPLSKSWSIEQLVIQSLTIVSVFTAVTILISSNAAILYNVQQSLQRISVHRDNRAKLNVITTRMVVMNLPTLISCLPIVCVVSIVLAGVQLHEAVLQWVIIVCVPQAATFNPVIYAIMKAREKLLKKSN